MASQQFISQLASLGKAILPVGASLWLYGSQARGEATADSDWDLLILLDKDKQEFEDFGRYAYPFTQMGVDNNEYIIPQIYTRKDWEKYAFTPFVKNVEHDKIVLV